MDKWYLLWRPTALLRPLFSIFLSLFLTRPRPALRNREKRRERMRVARSERRRREEEKKVSVQKVGERATPHAGLYLKRPSKSVLGRVHEVHTGTQAHPARVHTPVHVGHTWDWICVAVGAFSRLRLVVQCTSFWARVVSTDFLVFGRGLCISRDPPNSCRVQIDISKEKFELSYVFYPLGRKTIEEEMNCEDRNRFLLRGWVLRVYMEFFLSIFLRTFIIIYGNCNLFRNFVKKKEKRRGLKEGKHVCVHVIMLINKWRFLPIGSNGGLIS